ncbi:olfactory receptor 2A12-like [Phyllopteryx taeniolatus]|uniref:olfactory receptor 2A12-like n=1 Tax=Phyllopteryx taeniolatus TaxID=161469 RepID=UPI002AD585D1|nr:olfactory receptor 2A12-like [Phyllopteryx taeniolatus]
MGCPLLLACMCVERYLAVVRPVLYTRLRKWEYHIAVSSVVWVLTFSFCLASGIINILTIMLMPVCIVISCLFSWSCSEASWVWSCHSVNKAQQAATRPAPGHL